MKAARRVTNPVQRAQVAARSLSKREEDTAVERLKHTAVLRDSIRMGIPSKGRMAEDTIELLKSCQLKVYKPNPRQYAATIPQFPGVDVWFQRASDVVRKLRTGDLDFGIVGYDMFAEFAEEDNDLIVVHDALNFGQCKLALGVPMQGEYANVSTLEELQNMGWSEARPLRVVTGYTNIARRCGVLLLAPCWPKLSSAIGVAKHERSIISPGATARSDSLCHTSLARSVGKCPQPAPAHQTWPCQPVCVQCMHRMHNPPFHISRNVGCADSSRKRGSSTLCCSALMARWRLHLPWEPLTLFSTLCLLASRCGKIT